MLKYKGTNVNHGGQFQECGAWYTGYVSYIPTGQLPALTT